MILPSSPASTALPAAANDLVTFKVWSNSQDITHQISVVAISIHKAVNKIGYAILQISDGDIPQQSLPVSDQDWFLPGKKIKIEVGHNLQETVLFEGLVVRHEVRILAHQAPCLLVECKDAAVKTALVRKSEYYYDQKDSDLFSTLLDDYQLNHQIERTNEEYKSIVRYHCTDWDFIVTRADAQGMFVWTDDGKTHIAKPDFSAQPTFTLQYASSQIIEFEAEMDARNSWPGVEAYTWDPANQTVEKESAIEPNMTEQGDVPSGDVANALYKGPAQFYHPGQLESIEVQHWADGALQRSRLAKVRGRVCIVGQPQIKPMDWIAFDGFGNRFNGPAFVAAVRHEVKRGVWYTHLEFGLSPQPYARQAAADLADLPAAGLTPAIHGLHIGTVTALQHPDQTSGHLVQVVIPYVGQVASGGTSDGIWARLSNVTAGDDRGMVFRPEVGDEVVVGFVNNDPNHAIVLGALHSANAPAPVTADDTNPQKGIYCREGMQLIFDDDQKSVTILTTAGNTITLSDNDQSIKIEDQRGAKLEMNAQGITLDAGSGNITIQGTMINIG